MLSPLLKTADVAARRMWRAAGLRDLRLEMQFRRTELDWRKLKHEALPSAERGAGSSDHGGPRFLLIPPDPLLLTASKGDEAMLRTIVSEIRSRYPDAAITVATCSDAACLAAMKLEIRGANILGETRIGEVFREIRRIDPTHVITLGADVLDGSYDPNFSLRHIVLTDLACRLGAAAAVMGFSFSKYPFQALGEILDDISSDVRFYLRDPSSYDRFSRFCRAQAELAADLAFLMQPDERLPRDIEGWISEGVRAEKTLIGVNFHPLLFSPSDRSNLTKAIESLATVIKKFISEMQARVILIPHDFRGKASDLWCLDPLYRLLSHECGQSVFYPDRELSAPKLKALVGQLDAVLSGRMHLAIAALGMGVPVLGFSYKGKFEGLFRHFSIASEYLISTQEILAVDKLWAISSAFVNDRQNIRTQARAARSRVLDLSRVNLGVLDRIN